jgi:exosome complex RNA-binding protein Rrp42 (RNase PH superfamily)
MYDGSFMCIENIEGMQPSGRQVRKWVASAAASNRSCVVQLPDLCLNPETNKLEEQHVDGEMQFKGLQLQCFPLSFSFGILKDKLLSDPCADEEKQLLSSLTIVAHAENARTQVWPCACRCSMGWALATC